MQYQEFVALSCVPIPDKYEKHWYEAVDIIGVPRRYSGFTFKIDEIDDLKELIKLVAPNEIVAGSQLLSDALIAAKVTNAHIVQPWNTDSIVLTMMCTPYYLERTHLSADFLRHALDRSVAAGLIGLTQSSFALRQLIPNDPDSVFTVGIINEQLDILNQLQRINHG